MFRRSHLSVIFQQLVKNSKIAKKMATTTQLKLAPTVKLNNGYEMPVLGLGTYELKKMKCENAVRSALELGYRHIDTAYLYRNEAIIGKVLNETIASGQLKRDEVFLVTKLWDIYHEPERVRYACELQLKLLGLNYIDLYLMHSPVGVAYVNDEELMPHCKEGKLLTNDVDYVDTYKAMEQLVKLGLVRSLGVSNFNSEQLQRLLNNCDIKPVTNQVECHLEMSQLPLIEFCRSQRIIITAYSPLGRPKPSKPLPAYFSDSKVLALAQKYGKTPAQLALRYLLQLGTVVIPKAAQLSHLSENLDLFDFILTSQEEQQLHKFERGQRLWKFEKAKGHQHFPH